MVESYQRLYAGAYASKEYVNAVRGLVDTLQKKHRVDQRTRKVVSEDQEESAADEEPLLPEQKKLEWSK
jgi:cytochrome b subunit of formate dehydrogenase